MSYEPPTYTAEEILASTEAHAAHWENEARYSQKDVAFHCRDYAEHLRRSPFFFNDTATTEIYTFLIPVCRFKARSCDGTAFGASVLSGRAVPAPRGRHRSPGLSLPPASWGRFFACGIPAYPRQSTCAPPPQCATIHSNTLPSPGHTYHSTLTARANPTFSARAQQTITQALLLN